MKYALFVLIFSLVSCSVKHSTTQDVSKNHEEMLLTIDMDKEYTMMQRMMRLADLYLKFEKELPRKNYWEKFLL